MSSTVIDCFLLHLSLSVYQAYLIFHVAMSLYDIMYSVATVSICIPLRRTDKTLCTLQQKVAMSVPLGAWPPRWHPCCIALTTKVSPCSTGQPRKAKLKWYSLPLKNTTWTSLLLIRFVFDVLLKCAWNRPWVSLWDETREYEFGCTVLSLVIWTFIHNHGRSHWRLLTHMVVLYPCNPLHNGCSLSRMGAPHSGHCVYI